MQYPHLVHTITISFLGPPYKLQYMHVGHIICIILLEANPTIPMTSSIYAFIWQMLNIMWVLHLYFLKYDLGYFVAYV
jgi:hypothetical protein